MTNVTLAITLATLGIVRPIRLEVSRDGIARAEANRCERYVGQALICSEPCLYREGSALGQTLIVALIAERVRVALDRDRPVRSLVQ